MYDNPNLPEYRGFTRPGLFGGVSAKADGTYRIVGLPGPGLIGVYYQVDPYLRANERDDEFGTKEESLRTAPFIISFTSNFNAIARLDPAKGVDPARRDLTVDPGWAFKVRVLGPDGKHRTGVRILDFNTDRTWAREPLAGGEYAGRYNPRRSDPVLFQVPDQGLVGVAQPPKENGGSVEVRMEAGATVTGRLVEPSGKPRGGVELGVFIRPRGRHGWCDYSPGPMTTDRDGRFRLTPLPPGFEFELRDDRGAVRFGDLRAGEKDLGDVRATAMKD